MLRFHIVVFNYERMASFLDHFDKITNFDPSQDRLIIFDCSLNHESEKQKVIDFGNRHGWRLGKEIALIRRKNWGIDQGARVDYVNLLRATDERPDFIWQFQEHYLDLRSAWSFWANDLPKLGGQVKGDVIPDDFKIDLDVCERIYREHQAVAVIYADREKVGVFTRQDGGQSFYADGANFSVRTSVLLEAFTPDVLDSYKALYDGSYEWSLFMELDICRRLTHSQREWYDLVSHHHFADPAALRKLEAEKQIVLHQEAEPFYPGLYRKYEERFLSILDEGKTRRKLHGQLSLWYADFLASRAMQRFKLVFQWLGLAVVATRMRRYITGVLKH
jgi:hypothetical protein